MSTNQPLFIFSADQHLKPHLYARYREAQGDTYFGLKQVVDLCIEYKLPLVLGGDFFDRPVLGSEPFQVAHHELARLVNNSGQGLWRGNKDQGGQDQLFVVGVDGNHDRATPSWMSTLPVRNIDGESQDIFSHGENLKHPTRIYGIRCRDTNEVAEHFARIPTDTDLVICHQSLAELYPQDHAYRLEADQVPAHVKLVLMGHIHEPAEYLNPKTNTRFIFSGSTARMSTSEPDKKSVLLVSRAPDGSYVTERLPIKSRRSFDIAIHNPAEFEVFIADVVNGALEPDPSLPEELQKPFLRVVYDPTATSAIRLREVVGNLAHLRLLPLPAVVLDSILGIDNDGGISEHVPLDDLLTPYVARSQDPELYDFIRELAGGSDGVEGRGDTSSALERLRTRLDLGRSPDPTPKPPAPVLESTVAA